MLLSSLLHDTFSYLNKLWAIVHGLLYGLIQKVGYIGHLRTNDGPVPLVQSCL